MRSAALETLSQDGAFLRLAQSVISDSPKWNSSGGQKCHR